MNSVTVASKTATKNRVYIKIEILFDHIITFACYHFNGCVVFASLIKCFPLVNFSKNDMKTEKLFFWNYKNELTNKKSVVLK